MSEKYDLERMLTIHLSQARAAVLMDICARSGGFDLAPEEQLVLREIEATLEAEIDFVLDPAYRAILADIRGGLRREFDSGAPHDDDHPERARQP
ncbi:hypothetical protein [Mesorhizobium sp. B2-3-4]|uniref:hypothetical protein n=1 Tax=Mesorhizobium sp. B2-3-4 TaxID=2589959 RepID=UPI00112633F7|nr:hypothetical protein [Mesorhizobium sp. B2-3-4]TPM34245.1 hypothetical protein FJ967_22680 [Mesorhizobium sp. B2-3-4]